MWKIEKMKGQNDSEYKKTDQIFWYLRMKKKTCL